MQPTMGRTAPSIYDTVLKGVQQNKYATQARTRKSVGNLGAYLDLLNQEQNQPVAGNGGSTGGSGVSGYMGAPNTGSGAPSSGAIPPLATWKWHGHSLTTEAGSTTNKFRRLLNYLNSSGYKINDIGSYSYRNARGLSRLSEHAYGRAIDINSTQNPMGSSLHTNMPKNIARVAANLGLVWGGTWHSRKDPMHFSTTGY